MTILIYVCMHTRTHISIYIYIYININIYIYRVNLVTDVTAVARCAWLRSRRAWECSIFFSVGRQQTKLSTTCAEKRTKERSARGPFCF